MIKIIWCDVWHAHLEPGTGGSRGCMNTWEVRQNQVSSRCFYIQLIPGRGARPDLPCSYFPCAKKVNPNSPRPDVAKGANGVHPTPSAVSEFRTKHILHPQLFGPLNPMITCRPPLRTGFKSTSNSAEATLTLPWPWESEVRGVQVPGNLKVSM
jgi:hypothetical protein